MRSLGRPELPPGVAHLVSGSVGVVPTRPQLRRQFSRSVGPAEINRWKQNQTIFKKMQKCAGARLIVPDGAEYMYYAAIESKACKLTSLGAHYWELAKNRQL